MGCFSFLCPCLAGTSYQDARAQRQARDGLENIVRGYHQIARLELPAGAASVIADVRRSIKDLEKILRDVKMPKARQWLLPLPQEQADWETVHPEGGFLLRRQMSMASFGDEEWIVGCLFISDFGIAFDSGPMGGDSTIESGFLPWQDISGLHHLEPSPGRPKGLVTASVSGRKFSTLKLQLSIQGDVEWLLEFWKMRSSGVKSQQEPGLTDDAWLVPDTDEGVRVPPPTTMPKLMSPSGRELEPKEPGPTPLAPPLTLQLDAPKVQRTKSILSEKRRSMQVSRRWSSNLSSGFAEAPGGTPGGKEPSNAPTSKEQCQVLSRDMVAKALEDEECLARFVREYLGAFELSAVPWAKSRHVEGTLVRQLTFHMKLPDDVPRVVKRLISLPEASSVTMIFRLRTDAESVCLTYQTCTHDVTFGENFRVQETLSFSPLPDGGIEIRRWAEVVWVAPLPWTMSAIRSYIEEKSKNDGAKAVPALLRIVGELGK